MELANGFSTSTAMLRRMKARLSRAWSSVRDAMTTPSSCAIAAMVCGSWKCAIPVSSGPPSFSRRHEADESVGANRSPMAASSISPVRCSAMRCSRCTWPMRPTPNAPSLTRLLFMEEEHTRPRRGAVKASCGPTVLPLLRCQPAGSTSSRAMAILLRGARRSRRGRRRRCGVGHPTTDTEQREEEQCGYSHGVVCDWPC